MKKLFFIIVLCAGWLLAACSAAQPAAEASTSPAESVNPAAQTTPAAPSAAQPSATIDPCLPENVQILAQQVHSHMREFDDASTLAAGLKVSQLPAAIADLQRIRRNAEDEKVPACLAQLSSLEVAHMNTTINTLLALLNNAKVDDLRAGILQARQLHDAYLQELARVLGITLVPLPTQTTAPQDSATPVASQKDVTATPAAGPAALVKIKNDGAAPVNIRAKPDINAAAWDVMLITQVDTALGKSADGQWAQIKLRDDSGRKGWLYLPLLTVIGSLDDLPVVNP